MTTERERNLLYMHNSHLCAMLSVFIVIYVYLGLSKQELYISELVLPMVYCAILYNTRSNGEKPIFGIFCSSKYLQKCNILLVVVYTNKTK